MCGVFTPRFGKVQVSPTFPFVRHPLGGHRHGVRYLHNCLLGKDHRGADWTKYIINHPSPMACTQSSLNYPLHFVSMSTFDVTSGRPKTAIVTGGAGGIGAQTIRSFHAHGCNVVIADLAFARSAAESLMSSLSDPSRALFHETDITDWNAMCSLFRATKEKFGQVDIVIANAGLMESKGFFDFEEDENGELKEPKEAYKVVDVNLKGTMNSTVSSNHRSSLDN